MSKYHSKKVVVNGIEFDSILEAKRYEQLRLLWGAGKISNLRLQVPFELIPTVRIPGEPTLRKVIYKADFVYEVNGKVIIEDVKGYETDVFKIKRQLMELQGNHVTILKRGDF